MTADTILELSKKFSRELTQKTLRFLIKPQMVSMRVWFGFATFGDNDLNRGPELPDFRTDGGFLCRAMCDRAYRPPHGGEGWKRPSQVLLEQS